jgi:hypothetical protein
MIFNSTQIDPTKLVIWKAGRPAELWLSHRELVAGFIKKHNLKPLEPESYPSMPVEMTGASEAMTLAAASSKSKQAEWVSRIPWPKPFPGGIRIPHFHFGPDLYLVDRDQWKEFSDMVVRDVGDRLGKAREIGFEQVLELTEGTASLR